MPFLNLNTNLSKEKVTAETMNKLAQEMSVILGKDTKWINWMLSTDKLMSRVRLINVAASYPSGLNRIPNFH